MNEPRNRDDEKASHGLVFGRDDRVELFHKSGMGGRVRSLGQTRRRVGSRADCTGRRNIPGRRVGVIAEQVIAVRFGQNVGTVVGVDIRPSEVGRVEIHTKRIPSSDSGISAAALDSMQVSGRRRSHGEHLTARTKTQMGSAVRRTGRDVDTQEARFLTESSLGCGDLGNTPSSKDDRYD